MDVSLKISSAGNLYSEIDDAFQEELDSMDFQEDHSKSRIVKNVENEVNAQFGDLSPEIKEELDEVNNLKKNLKELRSKLAKLKNYKVPSLLHKNKELAEKRRAIKQQISNIQLRFEEIKAQKGENKTVADASKIETVSAKEKNLFEL